jgi:hypothetical protein
MYNPKNKKFQDGIVGSDSQCEVLAPPEPPVKVWDLSFSHEIFIFFWILILVLGMIVI